MPSINFNNAKKVFYQGKEIKKIYALNQLVWEQKRQRNYGITDTFLNAPINLMGLNYPVINLDSRKLKNHGITTKDITHIEIEGKVFRVNSVITSTMITIDNSVHKSRLQASQNARVTLYTASSETGTSSGNGYVTDYFLAEDIDSRYRPIYIRSNKLNDHGIDPYSVTHLEIRGQKYPVYVSMIMSNSVMYLISGDRSVGKFIYSSEPITLYYD